MAQAFSGLGEYLTKLEFYDDWKRIKGLGMQVLEDLVGADTASGSQW